MNTYSGLYPKSVHVEARISVHNETVWVFTFDQNRCSRCSRICSEYELHEFAKEIQRNTILIGISRSEAEGRISALKRRLAIIQEGKRSYYNDTEEGLNAEIERVESLVYEPSEEEYTKIHELVLALSEEDWKRHLVAIRQRSRRKNIDKRTRQLSISNKVFYDLSEFKENEQVDSWDDAFERLLEIYRDNVTNKKGRRR